ncbi:leucine-rich repeat domain-containing protein [Pseudomonas sp. CBSPCBW29]|nr:leucine-rich repeat domain-containing protein [Pseudomonas sp. CBSPCBW29]
MLDLSGTILGDLPLMPAAAFAHVQRLNLAGTRVSVAALNDFLLQFTQVVGLDLSRSNLMDLPESLTQLRSLKQLDLAHNQLTITDAIQRRLSALVTLRGLNLDYNRVGTLDVSGLNQLRSLSLSHTATTAWPTGWLTLPELRQVDLSYSAITTIPQAALTGHDLLMLSSNVRGCRLTLPACADIQRFALRTYHDNPLNVAPAMQPVFVRAFTWTGPWAFLARGWRRVEREATRNIFPRR